jgi:predicted dehydrogenase
MTDRLNIGIIGAGKVSQAAHVPAFKEVPEARIVAIADLDADLARAVAERHGVPRAYSSHDDLLADAEVEAAVVVVPRPAVGPVALACLKSRRHVLTEKPMCASVDQASRLTTAAREARRRHIIGYMKRFDAGVEWAKETLHRLFADESIGRMRFVRMHCYQGDDALRARCPLEGSRSTVPGPEWPMVPEWLNEEWHVPYHVYLNRYSHDVNLLRHLLPGRLEVVQFRFTELFAQLAVLQVGGVTVTLETGFNHYHHWDEVLEIYFERGRLSLHLPPPFLPFATARVELICAGAAGRPPVVERPQIKPSWAFVRQAAAFVAAVRSGGTSLAEAADAIEDIALIEAIWKRVERTRP